MKPHVIILAAIITISGLSVPAMACIDATDEDGVFRCGAVDNETLSLSNEPNPRITNSDTETVTITSDEVEPRLIGGDKDEHACLVAAGYSWCAAENKCVRKWEENCSSRINSFDECVQGSFPVMESYPRQCRSDEGYTFTEQIENSNGNADLVTKTPPIAIPFGRSMRPENPITYFVFTVANFFQLVFS